MTTRSLQKYSEFKIGYKLGVLTVIGESTNKWNQSCFDLLCECGNKISIIRRQILNQKGVGCKRCTGGKNSIKAIRTHGKSDTRLYSIWKDMVRRCTHPSCPSFHYYGGRGITIYPDWASDFISFEEWALLNGYSDNLTIDRRDNNGNYTPDNCRWVTMKVQRNNSRQNVYIEIDGVIKTRSQWAEDTGVPYEVIRSRQRLGWSGELAVKTPY